MQLSPAFLHESVSYIQSSANTEAVVNAAQPGVPARKCPLHTVFCKYRGRRQVVNAAQPGVPARKYAIFCKYRGRSECRNPLTVSIISGNKIMSNEIGMSPSCSKVLCKYYIL